MDNGYSYRAKASAIWVYKHYNSIVISQGITSIELGPAQDRTVWCILAGEMSVNFPNVMLSLRCCMVVVSLCCEVLRYSRMNRHNPVPSLAICVFSVFQCLSVSFFAGGSMARGFQRAYP